MTTFTSPQPPFTVTTESERNTEWPDGTRVYCKDTNKSYVLDDHTFVLIGGGSSAGGAAWGQIAGTLSAQTDLQGALNAKAASSHTHAACDISGSAVITTDPRLSDARTPLTHSHTKSEAGLANVDNTSDANKPVSTAGSAALNLKADLASPTLVTPNIGVATGTSLAVTGALTSSGSSGIGYAVGSGSVVTQVGLKSAGVTINKMCGLITMSGSALAAATIITFTVTNSCVAATDMIIAQHDSTGTTGAYNIAPNTPAAGSFKISVRNNSAASLSEAIKIRYAIIKAVIT
jgi:hypothetical protein